MAKVFTTETSVFTVYFELKQEKRLEIGTAANQKPYVVISLCKQSSQIENPNFKIEIDFRFYFG